MLDSCDECCRLQELKLDLRDSSTEAGTLERLGQAFPSLSRLFGPSPKVILAMAQLGDKLRLSCVLLDLVREAKDLDQGSS
jgi:hypothetical protein